MSTNRSRAISDPYAERKKVSGLFSGKEKGVRTFFCEAPLKPKAVLPPGKES
jgi:hypothetical protein